MRTSSAQWRAEAGATYLGVLILVVILGLTSTASLKLGTAIDRRMTEEELLYVGRQYRAALESYYRTAPPGAPRYPMTLQDLVKDPRSTGLRRHLRQLYPDPVTGKDDWVLLRAPGGGIVGLHSSSTRTPTKTANFPAPFQFFEGQTSYAKWVFHADSWPWIYQGRKLPE